MPTDSLLKAAAIGVGSVLGSMYLDARFHLSKDLGIVHKALQTRRATERIVAEGRTNVYYYFKEKAKATPDDIFLVFEDKNYTFRDIEKASNRLAHWLLEKNVQYQDHVCMMQQNHPSFIILWFAILKIGAVAAFINNNLTEDSLWHCIKVAEAKILIFDPKYETQVSTILSKVPPFLSMYTYGEATQYDEFPSFSFAPSLTPSVLANYSDDDVSEDYIKRTTENDRAMLIYTSGTTGMPKAAPINHSRAMLGAVTFCLTMNILPSDRIYAVLPLYHSSASIIATLAPLYGGATVILGRRFSARHFWDEVIHNKVTGFIYIGEMCRYLLSQPPCPQEKLHNVRFICGNGMRPDVWSRFRERFNIPRIIEFYASTEGPGGFYNDNTSEYGAGAIGRRGPLIRILSPQIKLVKVDPITETPVRNANGFLVQADFDEEGEMIVQLESQSGISLRFDGYYNNKAATNKKLIKDAFKKGDIYYRSGDLLRLSGEGFVYFVDRIGDTFRWKSENVATTEVAHAVSTFPGILEANVYGTLVPGHDGRASMAAICVQDENTFDFKGLAAHLKNKLPSYAVPLFLRIVPSMETTGTFKQQKVNFRNQGIDLSKIPEDEHIYWLRGDNYIRFDAQGYDSIKAGKAKL
ncbi:uncharacterized protein BX664DRAFT_330018 [Halteromyces radiatus]|uniref:uncharacterized protein n=1 Tax=Halteromyces radiatus TaxID=101107 RepID=UPI00221E9FE1|nr:uncharacterized protein BX664DRAFT_330018 [Halteromyces radiatus]KAI8093581.1 hypothetical protein BX664DRAFT_330018 [Halteromyces radiatus]